MVPTSASRANAASDAGSNVPSWSRWSSASSRFTDVAEPAGSTSRAAYGRSIKPGVMGSIVLPQR